MQIAYPALLLDDVGRVHATPNSPLDLPIGAVISSTLRAIENFKRVTPMKKTILIVAAASLCGCASTAPTKIGADTYYASRTNTAGIFGDVSAVAGRLMGEGNEFCEGMGKEFELVTQHVTDNIPGVRLGGASITFRCVAHAGNPVMRPDNGVSTIQQ
ncbi:hypothetical protein FSO04_30830 [Paraburkholderia madseniana]|uniref:Uncharacterized protein n=1 Tax=Paraburkholderia madseniana TaxID=2599607 RepID=A0A6N6W7A1_9BURK|nr:hypothetical protein [Paraburkholderia madseniana]KAE8756101.1 hypothetical protein FSO04_30830 [Paraburkholderia madseniana]